MTDLFTVTAPLTIRHPDGTRRLMVEIFPHPDGVLYFEPFWHLDDDRRIHVAEGGLRGEGPWKIGESVITVAGCHGVDADIAAQVAEWQQYLQMYGDEYPDKASILAIARHHGASV